MSTRGIAYKTLSNQRKDCEPGVFNLCETQSEPVKKPSPSSTPTPLWNISLQIHNSPIPLWMLSKMKACTGALSALLSLSLSAQSLWSSEKKESEYSSSSCTLQPFYTTCFDLLTACCRHSNGSKSLCLCIRSFSPSFTLVWLMHLFACPNRPSSVSFSLCVPLPLSLSSC